MYASLLTQPGGLFGSFERLRRELDDVFSAGTAAASIRSGTAGTLPPLNVGRTPSSFEVYVFAPGLDASKIEVSLDRGVLRIAGERASDIPSNDPKLQVYTRERSVVDPERVNASYRDGVLQVSVGRREATQPKRIQVQ